MLGAALHLLQRAHRAPYPTQWAGIMGRGLDHSIVHINMYKVPVA